MSRSARLLSVRLQSTIYEGSPNRRVVGWMERMAAIEIYTQPGCPYCTRALALLSGKGVTFREIDAPHGTRERVEARERSGGRTSVPQIFIGTRHVGGCDDLMALNRSGELDTLLQAA